MAEVNREFKSELFAFLFGREENKKWALSLYNAMNSTQVADLKDLQIMTIENYLYLGMKNDVALMIRDVLGVFEHQSTFNPNMPVRELMYAARLYDKYLQLNEINRYSSKRIPLPAPRLVVFYNGTEDRADQVLRLSDSFDEENRAVADIEVTVHMYNINYDRRSELLKKCKPLEEYAWFIDRVRMCGEVGIEEAVAKAIDDMPENFEIRPFLLAHRAEVIGMMFMDYNEEETMRLVRKEAEEDGRALGSNDTIRAIKLLNSGVNSLKALIKEGIPESIAQNVLNQFYTE